MAEPCRGDIEDYIAASPWSDWAVGVPDKPVREWGGLNWANYALALLARLSASEQERALLEADRDHWKEACAHWSKISHNLEARAEAAEAGFKAYDDSDGAMPSDAQWAAIVAARAALAGREEPQ